MNSPTVLSSVCCFSHQEANSSSQLLNLGCPRDLLWPMECDRNDVFRLLKSGPLASIFHLGTQLPHNEIQVPLLERVDSWRDRPWRMRDHRLRKSPHRRLWQAPDSKAPSPRCLNKANMDPPTTLQLFSKSQSCHVMNYPCFIWPKLLLHGILNEIMAVASSR